jgi:hypothetical protein
MLKRLSVLLGAVAVIPVGCSSTPSHSNDAGIDAGWTPAQMSGLVLWLNNGTWTLDAGAAVAWPDSSPKGHSLEGGPTHQAPTVDAAAFNGRDALHFSANNATIMAMTQQTTDFQWGTAPFVAEVVVRPDDCVSPPCPVWLSSDQTETFPVALQLNSGDGGTSLAATVTFAWGNNLMQGSSAPFASGQIHVLGTRRTGSTAAEVRVDGVATPFTLSPAVNDQLPEGVSIGFGGIGAAVSGLDGDIAEVVASTSASDSDVAQLEAYLKVKYGL